MHISVNTQGSPCSAKKSFRENILKIIFQFSKYKHYTPWISIDKSHEGLKKLKKAIQAVRRHNKLSPFWFFLLKGLGVGMIIVGIFAVANVSNIYIDQIKPLLDLLIVATVKMDSVTLFRTLCISMVVIGTLLLVVVGVGFGGTCCHNRKALLVVSKIC